MDFDEALQRAEDKRLSAQQRQLQRECVLLPSSRTAAAWRFIIVPLIFWTVFITPLELALSWWKHGIWMDVVAVFVDFFFIIDMVFSVFVAPFKSGTLQISWRYRVRSYLKSWFLADCLANFPWYLIIQGKETKTRKLVKLLKVPKVFRIMRLLRVFREGAHYFGVIYTVVGVVLIVHYVACIWIWALIDCKDAITLWHIDRNDVACPDPWSTYSEAVLVAVGTFRGADSWLQFKTEGSSSRLLTESEVGGFEWTGEPPAEIAVTLISMVETLLLAVLFANVARSLGEQDAHTRHFHQRLENLHKTHEQKGLNRQLYHRVKKHYHYLWSCGNQWGAEVLQDEALTDDLRRELALSLYGEHLRTVPFLAACDEVFLKQLCSCVVLQCFSPKDFIISAGEFGTDLYFLVIGQVRIQAPETKEVLRTLVPGSFFGEMGLLVPDSYRVVDVVAVTHGWMLSVGRESLQAICSEELLETFCSVALERYLEQDASGVEHLTKAPEGGGGFRSVRRSSMVGAVDPSAAGRPAVASHLQGFRRQPSRSNIHAGAPRATTSHGAPDSRNGSKERPADAWSRSRAGSGASLSLEHTMQTSVMELMHNVAKRLDKIELRMHSLEGLLSGLAWAKRADEEVHGAGLREGQMSRTFSGTVGTQRS